MNLKAFLPAMRSMRDGLTECPSAHETRHGVATGRPTGSRRLHRSAQQAKEYVECMEQAERVQRGMCFPPTCAPG